MRRILLPLLIFSAGCSVTEPSNPVLHFAGTVTAAATGQPILGARIELASPTTLWAASATAFADAQGSYALSYKLDPCLDGDYGSTLTASASGFASKTTTITCEASVQTINFSLDPAP